MRFQRRRRGQKKTRRFPVVVFALVSLIPITVLGFFLSRMVEARNTDHTLTSAGRVTHELVLTTSRGVFGPDGLAGGLDADGEAAAAELFGGVVVPATFAVDILFIDPEGLVVWAQDAERIGSRVRLDDRMLAAFDGELDQQLSTANGGTQYLDHTLPVTMTDDGDASGIVRLRSEDPTVLEDIGTGMRNVNLVLAIGLFGVWLFLVPLAYTIMSRIWGQADRERQLRLIDPLTGLGNRSLLMQRLEESLASASRNNTQIGLLLIDLDGFKAVNDTGGHAIGDRLLIKVAERLLETTRRAELAVRLGGDEFAVLVPNVGRRDELDVLSMRLGRALDFPLEFDNGAHIRVTASIGIALFPEDATSVDDLLAAADGQMYHEKRRYYSDAGERGSAVSGR